MRVLILGGDGMLGHRLLAAARAAPRGAGHAAAAAATTYRAFGLFDRGNAYDGDRRARPGRGSTASSPISRPQAVDQRGRHRQAAPGRRRRRAADRDQRDLAAPARARLPRGTARGSIHLSTDCVFSGEKGNYTRAGPPRSGGRLRPQQAARRSGRPGRADAAHLDDRPGAAAARPACSNGSSPSSGEAGQGLAQGDLLRASRTRGAGARSSRSCSTTHPGGSRRSTTSRARRSASSTCSSGLDAQARDWASTIDPPTSRSLRPQPRLARASGPRSATRRRRGTRCSTSWPRDILKGHRMMFEGKRILVTGGTGSMGKHVRAPRARRRARHAEEGDRVLARRGEAARHAHGLPAPAR